ncbi:unnamed protein product, partial [Urochloa humidicola]
GSSASPPAHPSVAAFSCSHRHRWKSAGSELVTGGKEEEGNGKEEKGRPAAPSPTPAPLKPSLLQLRMKDESAEAAAAAAVPPPPPVLVGPRGRELLPPPSSNYEAWDLSDSESAPASSWATLPNRALLCRPLPQDVGRCTCVIARQTAAGARGVAIYSLYT